MREGGKDVRENRREREKAEGREEGGRVRGGGGGRENNEVEGISF